MASRYKRDKGNLENLKRYFTTDDGPAYQNEALQIYTAEEALAIMRLFLIHPTAFARIISFARSYKQTVGEIEAADIQEIRDLQIVKQILES